MTLSRLFVFALAALVATGCDSSDPEPPPEPEPIRISGRYDGTANVDGLAVTLETTLSEISNSVSGSGTLRISNPVAVTATGSHVPPDFNITFRATGLEDLNYAGTTNSTASVMTGRLNGSGFVNIPLTLIRGNPSAAPGSPEAAAVPTDVSFGDVPEGITTFRELFELEAQQ